MLQEIGLNCCEDPTGTSIFLIDAIVDFTVEKETLMPRVVEVRSC
jgi:hypothetical protein